MAAAPPSSAMHCRLTRSLSLAASSSSSTTPPLCSVPARQRRRCVASVRQWQAFSSRALPCCLLRPGVVSLFCWRGGIGLGTPGQVRLNSWASSARPRPSVATTGEAVTSVELPKNFDFAVEERLYEWWESQGYFKPNPDLDKEPFVISMPPPNVTGALHMGHAMFVTLQDIMARFWRMKGRPTLWVPGCDHAGIATQLVVEKLLASQGVKRADLGREEFVQKVWEVKETYAGAITKQLRCLGASCDWSRFRFTLDDQLSRGVIEAFVRLHEKGLVYRGTYMVNWSPNLQTAVSDLEVEYSEEPGKLYFFKYPISGGTVEDYLPVATTRPETVLGDTAVAVHPEDNRYSKYVGKMAVVPMSGGREIPIIADDYVDREFGTGALKITPGHDPNDYAIGKKVGLPVINIMNKDGTLNENAGTYCGLDRFEARKKLWADMETAGLVLKSEPYTLRVPRSQRGGEVVEPLVSKQWFVTMQPLAEKALKARENGDLQIIPERFEKVYDYWLTNIKDWCISRQLWWGHRIPVWYVEGHEEDAYVVAHSEADAYSKAKLKYGETVKLVQDTDVLDTWFSSGLWPFSTLGWPDTSADDYKRFYPTTVLETGHDILFFWVARMVMMGIEFTGRTPFSTVYLHGLVRDAQGRKMSKTLGNVINPLDTIKEFGTDALRFTLATGTTPGQDVNLSMERLTANRSFTTKLWNAGKFILQNLPECSDTIAWKSLALGKFDTRDSLLQLPLSERWVVSKLHHVVDLVTASYEKFEIGEAGRTLYDFFWFDFADWYIEASKTRLYQRSDPARLNQAQSVLVYVFGSILQLLHPFVPFVTEELWQAMPHEGDALIVSQWPKPGKPKDLEALQHFEQLQSLIRAVRNARAEYAVEPARRISATVVVADRSLRHHISEENSVLIALARVDPQNLEISGQCSGVTNMAVHLVVADGLEAFLPLADMVDIRKEVDRLAKQAAKLQSEFDGNMKRLQSPQFVEKAPAAVVQGIREKASEAEEKLASVKRRLNELQSMSTAST